MSLVAVLHGSKGREALMYEYEFIAIRGGGLRVRLDTET